MSFIGLANIYKCRPSSLLGIEDAYTAFCFDEACAYILSKLENDEKPTFKSTYNSFSDLYSNYK